MKQPETKFKEKALRDLKTLKSAWFFKSQEVVIRGIPDIILCLCGFFFAIELKKDDKAKPSKLQLFHLEKIQRKANGVSIIASPQNWGEIFAYLQLVDKGKNPLKIARRF